MYIIDRKIILFLIMIIYVSQFKDFSNTLKIMGWKPGKLNRESFRCRESCLIFKTCIPIEDKSWHESANFDDIYRLISWNRIGERMFSCWKLRKNLRIHDFRHFHRRASAIDKLCKFTWTMNFILFGEPRSTKSSLIFILEI